MKILICGFMGAGKSTLLKKFMPNKLGFEVIDLDHAVALEQNIRPERLGEWILKNGFPLFRDKEKTKLKRLLNHPSSMVIALGGGALNDDILAFIHNNIECFLVYLDTPFEVCLERIKDDPERPLAKIPLEELKKLYTDRQKFYREADLVLDEGEVEKLQENKEIDALSALVHNLHK